MRGRHVGAVFDVVQQRLQFTACRRVRRLNDVFENRVLVGCNRFSRARRYRLSAVPTPVVMGSKRLSAVPTRLSDSIGRVVTFDDARLSKDIFRVFRRRDVLVGIPHVGIERPMNTVLDLGPTVALADHSRNRRVSEGVGFDVRFQVGPVGDAPQLLPDGVRVHSPVVTPPTITVSRRGLKFVEQGDLRFVRSRVRRSKVGANRPLGVDQRVLRNRRSLQPHRVAVRRVRRRVRQIDVLDSKRQGQRQSRTRVGKELDKRNVPLVSRRRRERLNIGRRENVVGTQRVSVTTGPVDVIRPLNAGHVLEIDDDGRLVGFDGAVGQVVVVAEVENEVVEIALVKFDDGRVRSFARKADPTEVDFQAGHLDCSTLLAEPVVDRAAVRFVDGRAVFESAAFVLQTLRKILRVVGRHTPTTDWCYYKLPTRESISSISSEIAEQRSDETGNSTLREGFLDQFEGDRRMREAARTDPLQTHLTARDARTWGGVPV